MTAPDNPLLGTIAQAMTDSDMDDMGTCGDPEYYDRQARAVLDAISEAGAVEWGTETVHEKTGAVLDRDVWQTEKSARSVNRKYGDRVVSRVVTAWTAVEP